MPDISIIIPCFNCEKTLKEAVDSIFKQKISTKFEIVLVDDCSTDNTRKLIQELASSHAEITYSFNEKNLGGGATRNIATTIARSNLIFCLDSDDMLGNSDMIQNIINLQKEKNCDGVGISTSIKFKGRDTNNVAFVNNFEYVGQKIPFESLIQKDHKLCSLYSTFLFTKKAFEVTGGYPTNHGFDTQGFAWRFLANGLDAYTCPNTSYLHRINFHKSYYLREYESGKINHNWRKIYEDFFYLFNTKTKELILNFDFNNPTGALNSEIEKLPEIFENDFEKYLVNYSKNKYKLELEAKSSKDMFDYYWLGSEALNSSETEAALKYFKLAIESGMTCPIIFAKLVDAMEMCGQKPELELIAQRDKFYNYTLQGSKASLFQRIKRKIIKLINK